MSLVRALWMLIGIVGIFPDTTLAQRSRLDCPRPVRERKYRVRERPSVELTAGLTTPLLYRNGAGPLAPEYSFNSRPTPYASAIAYFRVNAGLDAFAGVGIMQLWQGLAFRAKDQIAALEVNSYAGSVVASLPFGVRFRAGDRLTINTGAYLAYAAHKGQRNIGGDPRNMGGAFFSYDAPDDRGINYGLRVGADFRVIRRLGLSVVLAADGRRSAPGEAMVRTGGQRTTIQGAELKPYLMHAGLGVTYRLFQHAID